MAQCPATRAAMASPTRVVLAVPPRSGVRGPLLITSSMCRRSVGVRAGAHHGPVPGAAGWWLFTRRRMAFAIDSSKPCPAAALAASALSRSEGWVNMAHYFISLIAHPFNSRRKILAAIMKKIKKIINRANGTQGDSISSRLPMVIIASISLFVGF